MLETVNDIIINAIDRMDEMVWCVHTGNLSLPYFNCCFERALGATNQDSANIEQAFYEAIGTPGLNTIKDTIEKVKVGGSSHCSIPFQPAGSKPAVIRTKIVASLTGIEDVMVTCFGTLISPAEAATTTVADSAVPDNLTILDNIRDVFFIVDRNGDFVFINKAFANFLSQTQIYAERRNVWEVFPDALGMTFESAFHRSFDEQVSLEFEEFLTSIDRWISVLTYPSAGYLAVFVHDITKRKLNAENVEKSEKKFHMMSDNSPMFIWTLNETMQSAFFNKTFITFTGLSGKELSNEGWLQAVHPDDLALVKQVLDRELAARNDFNFECRVRHQNGFYRWIKWNGVPQIEASGAFLGYLVNGVDFTDLKFYYETLEGKNKELERALDESRRLSEILNKTSNVLVLTDVEGKITWVNEAFMKVKEYTLEEVVGKKPGTLVYGPETSPETIEILHQGIKNRVVTQVEILNYSKYGNKMWMDVRIEPLYKDGIAEGYMAIEMDITKRKKDELAIQERNEKIKEFSFITSHDLRHEFAKVMMLLNLAKSKESTVDEYKALFDHLEGPVNKINSIISKINSRLYLGETVSNKEEKRNEINEIREICLVDDDELTNMIHRQIIKIIMPQTPVKVYEGVDEALTYFKAQPSADRLIFLDLVFLNGKSGWEFLDEYDKSEVFSQVVILSSSIDNDDLEKSKKYKCVWEYFVKPLTADTLHKYIKRRS